MSLSSERVGCAPKKYVAHLLRPFLFLFSFSFSEHPMLSASTPRVTYIPRDKIAVAFLSASRIKHLLRCTLSSHRRMRYVAYISKRDCHVSKDGHVHARATVFGTPYALRCHTREGRVNFVATVALRERSPVPLPSSQRRVSSGAVRLTNEGNNKLYREPRGEVRIMKRDPFRARQKDGGRYHAFLISHPCQNHASRARCESMAIDENSVLIA